MRLLLVLCSVTLLAQDVSQNIRVNQVGYLPLMPKMAAFTGGEAQDIFYIRRASDGEYVYANWIGERREDANSGETVRALEFNDLRDPGRYFIEIPEIGRSYEFEISPDVYKRAWYLAMRSFYGQRCGTAVDLGEEFPGYRYEECHRRGAWHASSGKEGERESRFGWHDAGDYGRYVVNSGITTGTLLWAFELYKSRIEGISLNIPESSNSTPDILDEVRWNLDWMLTMQDGDGGVWHKQTSANFPGFILPHRDNTVSIVAGTASEPYKSTCATADFAAVMAIAARIFQPYDPDYSARTLAAAVSAWNWSEANPTIAFRNPPGVSTGEYGDGNCSDERLWAAAELWRTTGEPMYHEPFLGRHRAFLGSIRTGGPPGWGGVGALALWTYALSGREDINIEAREAIRDATLSTAKSIAERTLANPYRNSMNFGDFYWGSNSVALNYSLHMLIADRMAPSEDLRNAALENIHYLLGRNAFSVSWVTWVGTNYFKRPHHRPSGSDSNAEPWPGLLSGGPNSRRDDNTLRALPEGLAPMKVWIDHQDSYGGNENAINWNSPLVFVLAAGLPDPVPPPQPDPPPAAIEQK